MKLILLVSMFHSLILIHLTCWAWETALTHLAVSSWWCTSSTTRCRRSIGVAFCHHGVVAPRPKPCQPCWMSSMISPCLRAALASVTAAVGFHLFPVGKVRAEPLTILGAVAAGEFFSGGAIEKIRQTS